jgi:hypothetical protein
MVQHCSFPLNIVLYHFRSSQPIFLRSILLLPSHLVLGLPTGCFRRNFHTKKVVCVSFFPPSKSHVHLIVIEYSCIKYHFQCVIYLTTIILIENSVCCYILPSTRIQFVIHSKLRCGSRMKHFHSPAYERFTC